MFHEVKVVFYLHSIDLNGSFMAHRVQYADQLNIVKQCCVCFQIYLLGLREQH